MKPFNIISVPNCPPNQRRLCVIGLLYMAASIIVFLIMVSGCYISWNNGVLEVGEGNRPVQLGPPPSTPPVVPVK